MPDRAESIDEEIKLTNNVLDAPNQKHVKNFPDIKPEKFGGSSPVQNQQPEPVTQPKPKTTE